MRLATASLDALPAAIASKRPDVIISAHSPSQPMQEPWGGPWLPLAFHHAEGLGHRGPVLYTGRLPSMALPGSTPGAPIVLPALTVVEALVAWLEAYRPSVLLVACRAILGRPSALEAIQALASAIPQNQLVSLPAVLWRARKFNAWDVARSGEGSRSDAHHRRRSFSPSAHAIGATFASVNTVAGQMVEAGILSIEHGRRRDRLFQADAVLLCFDRFRALRREPEPEGTDAFGP